MRLKCDCNAKGKAKVSRRHSEIRDAAECELKVKSEDFSKSEKKVALSATEEKESWRKEKSKRKKAKCEECSWMKTIILLWKIDLDDENEWNYSWWNFNKIDWVLTPFHFLYTAVLFNATFDVKSRLTKKVLPFFGLWLPQTVVLKVLIPLDHWECGDGSILCHFNCSPSHGWLQSRWWRGVWLVEEALCCVPNINLQLFKFSLLLLRALTTLNSYHNTTLRRFEKGKLPTVDSRTFTFSCLPNRDMNCELTRIFIFSSIGNRDEDWNLFSES